MYEFHEICNNVFCVLLLKRSLLLRNNNGESFVFCLSSKHGVNKTSLWMTISYKNTVMTGRFYERGGLSLCDRLLNDTAEHKLGFWALWKLSFKMNAVLNSLHFLVFVSIYSCTVSNYCVLCNYFVCDSLTQIDRCHGRTSQMDGLYWIWNRNWLRKCNYLYDVILSDMHTQDVTYRMKYNNIGIPMTTPTNMKTERSTYHEIFSKNWRKWYNVKIWKNSKYDKRRIDKLTRCNFPVNKQHAHVWHVKIHKKRAAEIVLATEKRGISTQKYKLHISVQIRHVHHYILDLCINII